MSPSRELKLFVLLLYETLRYQQCMLHYFMGRYWEFIAFLKAVCQEISDDPSVKHSEAVTISGVTSANDLSAPNFHRPISYLPPYCRLNSATLYDIY